MTSLDAWVDDWEIGCCRSVPPPGEPWSAILVFSGVLVPSGSVRLDRLPSGDMQFGGPVVERFHGAGQAMAILRCGPVHVFVTDPTDGDGFEGEGRLYDDNHVDYMDQADLERWKTSGTIRRLWVVPGNDGEYRDWPDETGGLLKGDPKEVAAIDPRWVGPHPWEARLEVEVDR